MLESFENFLVDSLIGFSKIFSSFGMSDDNIFYAYISEHIRSDLSGICTLFFIVHIFSADFNIASLSCFNGRDDIDCGHTENNICIFGCHEGL